MNVQFACLPLAVISCWQSIYKVMMRDAVCVRGWATIGAEAQAAADEEEEGHLRKRRAMRPYFCGVADGDDEDDDDAAFVTMSA